MPPPNMNQPAVLRRAVSNETIWLSAICLLDLITTLYWVSQGQAREGNPALAFFLDQGVFPFVAVKLFTFVPALIIAEWYRPRNPRLISKALQWTIIGYLFLYVAGVGAHFGKVLDFYRHMLLG